MVESSEKVTGRASDSGSKRTTVFWTPPCGRMVTLASKLLNSAGEQRAADRQRTDP
jgi:hypothetical protein